MYVQVRSFNFLASTYTHLADQYYKVMMMMMIMMMTSDTRCV